MSKLRLQSSDGETFDVDAEIAKQTMLAGTQELEYI